jgi:RNA polymerase sigma-70 factor, ECF subfamily
MAAATLDWTLRWSPESPFFPLAHAWAYTRTQLWIRTVARSPREHPVVPSGPSSRSGDPPFSRRQQYRLDATVELLAQVREGDDLALDVLCQRVIPPLERWATGRLPARARDLVETGDIVQETVLKSLRSLDRFEAQRDGALLAYLRTAIMNRVRDEARRVGRRPAAVEIDDRSADTRPSPLEEVIGAESIRIYEESLQRLKPDDREAVIARLEMGMSFAEVASALGKTNANTARMTVNRALLRLAKEMRHVQ